MSKLLFVSTRLAQTKIAISKNHTWLIHSFQGLCHLANIKTFDFTFAELFTVISVQFVHVQ